LANFEIIRISGNPWLIKNVSNNSKVALAMSVCPRRLLH